MSWFFEGTGVDIGFGTTAAGTLTIYGSGRQDCRPVNGDYQIADFVREGEGDWNIYSSDADHADIDGVGRGFEEFYESQKEPRPSAMITCYPKEAGMPPSVGATIIMPPEIFGRVFSLATVIIGRKDLRYVISTEFLGLVEEGSDSTFPTFREFTHSSIMERRPYFCDQVSFSVPPSSSPSRAS